MKVYHNSGWCVVCSEARPHWHETDPRPIEAGWANAPVDSEGLKRAVDNEMKDGHYWPYQKYEKELNAFKKSSPEAVDAYIRHKRDQAEEEMCWVCDNRGFVPRLVGSGEVEYEPCMYCEEKMNPLQNRLEKPEPSPIFREGDSNPVWPTLYAYMKARVKMGMEKYGQRLSTNDGRDGLHDALDEVIDLCFYLMKVVMEEQDKRIREQFPPTGIRGGVESGY